MEYMICGSLLVCFVFAWERFFPPDWEILDPYAQILMDDVVHSMGKHLREANRKADERRQAERDQLAGE